MKFSILNANSLQMDNISMKFNRQERLKEGQNGVTYHKGASYQIIYLIKLAISSLY